jgi:hypothetical protein
MLKEHKKSKSAMALIIRIMGRIIILPLYEITRTGSPDRDVYRVDWDDELIICDASIDTDPILDLPGGRVSNPLVTELDSDEDSSDSEDGGEMQEFTICRHPLQNDELFKKNIEETLQHCEPSI